MTSVTLNDDIQPRSQMTLAEKASLTSGANFWNTKSIPRLGVRSIMLTDGPHGLRKQGGAADHLGLNASIPATCFPTAATLANSWDITLTHRVGQALGAEAAAENVDVLLGPGLNIKRNPLAGRSFEYFSEDPLLSGSLAAAMIQGIQSRGVAACAKHFAVNSQETHRMSIDEIVDTRALQEIYLEGFRIAVTQGKPWSVMSAYNKVNGTYANENEALLQGILREDWGFDGLIVTDWGGNNDRVAGLIAGNALEMPSADGVTDREVAEAVASGRVDESVLDARVDELLTLVDRTSMKSAERVDHDAHHALAIDAARRSMVLAANRAGTLPLRDSAGRVAVIGDFAENPRYQGAGSSLVNPTRVDDPLTALRATELNIIGYAPGFRRRDIASARLRRTAVKLAAHADVVLLFLGLDESAEAEGVDRAHMRLAENQLALTRELIALGKSIVVVLAGGAPVELPFADDVDAIVMSYLGGQGVGPAIADVLTGQANPAGKLAETYPLRYSDVPSAADFAKSEATSEHRESIYIGYRYYDKVGAAVRYPFGHGLSYTPFAFADLVVGRSSATVTVTNTGALAGSEIVQMYAEAPHEARGEFRAPRELIGFAKVDLAPGESRAVEVSFAEHAFGAFDAAAGAWRTVGGTYRVLAGASSRDIRLSAEAVIDGDALVPAGPVELPNYRTGTVQHVDAAEFTRLLGRPLPRSTWDANAPLGRDDIVAQTKGRGGFASFFYSLIITASRVMMALGRPHASNNIRFALDLPFRSIERMSGGRVNGTMLDAILLMMNRQFWGGLRRLIPAWWAHSRAHRTNNES